MRAASWATFERLKVIQGLRARSGPRRPREGSMSAEALPHFNADSRDLSQNRKSVLEGEWGKGERMAS